MEQRARSSETDQLPGVLWFSEKGRSETDPPQRVCLRVLSQEFAVQVQVLENAVILA